jgi:hypothetical protein
VKTEDDTQDDPWCLFWPSCDASRFQSLGSLIALWIGVSPSLLVYQISYLDSSQGQGWGS